MPVVDEIREANLSYASKFAKGDLPMPPGRRFAVVTCMDARLDPAKFLGLDEGDAHVIRNAGAVVTDDALRSLIISHHLLGGKRAVGREEDPRVLAAAGLIRGARLRLRRQDRRAAGSPGLTRLRKAEVDLRRRRVRPA